ncbi:MAG: substrate-binding domain-containing protein [Pyrinomonadaceae bacterium]|nr:substrate-binding domain-containing protein [Sphingobacteriaceae bacterium]
MKSFVFVIVSIFVISCSREKKQTKSQPEILGIKDIIVDESFAPIIEDEYMVFRSSYPELDVNLTYKPEVQLLNILLSDSIRIAIMSRELTKTEIERFEKKNIKIRTIPIATDAIALITHKSNTDSTITLDEIKSIMKGNPTERNLVFDNPNSSTVRYLKELTGVNELPKKGIYAFKSSAEVIKYAHNNPGTIGVIGINWMKQPPVELETLVDNLKTLAVKNFAGLPGADKFYKPNQNNLAIGVYALKRTLYIIDCQGGSSGTEFAAFIQGDIGQRIILKSGLLPDKIPTREIIIRKTITP